MDLDKVTVNKIARDMMTRAKHVASRDVAKGAVSKNDTVFAVENRIICLNGPTINMRLCPDENRMYVVGSNGYDKLFEMDADTAQRAKKFLLYANCLVKCEHLRALLRSFSCEIIVTTCIIGAIIVYCEFGGKGRQSKEEIQKSMLEKDTIQKRDSISQNATMYWHNSQNGK